MATTNLASHIVSRNILFNKNYPITITCSKQLNFIETNSTNVEYPNNEEELEGLVFGPRISMQFCVVLNKFKFAK